MPGSAVWWGKGVGWGCINGTHFVLCSEEVFELFTVVVVGLITLLCIVLVSEWVIQKCSKEKYAPGE